MARILLVDDEPDILRALSRELHGTEWEITRAHSAEDAIEQVKKQTFEVVMSDYRMPGMTGVDLLTEVKKIQPAAVRLILSGYTDAQAILKSVNDAHIFKYLVKPWKSEELQDTLRLALEHRERLLEGGEMLKKALAQDEKQRQRQAELRRLEALEPGLTEVDFSPNDTIWLEDL